jgi:DNA-binding FadR family transcriptional regulator
MMNSNGSKFDLIAYLSSGEIDLEDGEFRIPPLSELSKEKGISIAALREQLGVARAFGFVDVQPRTGIHRRPYSFTPAVRTSLSYAIELDRRYFEDFSSLRRHVEANYWFEAVEQLDREDVRHLQQLVSRAWEKLEGSPPRLPHQEHRDLHLTIYGKIDNVFVLGLLEAYWDAYEAVGYSRYTELSYLKSVWQFHEQIIAAIAAEDFDQGYHLLLEHMDLIQDISSHKAEKE